MCTVISIEKNIDVHDDGDSFVWTSFSRPELCTEVDPGSRKQEVLGLRCLFMNCNFDYRLLDTFALLEFSPPPSGLVHGMRFVEHMFLLFEIDFLENPLSPQKTTPERKGTACKGNPGPGTLPGKSTCFQTPNTAHESERPNPFTIKGFGTLLDPRPDSLPPPCPHVAPRS